MQYSVFGLSVATIFQVFALVILLLFELFSYNKSLKISVIVVFSVISVVLGFKEFAIKQENETSNKREKEVENAALDNIKAGVEEVGVVTSTTTRTPSETSENSRYSLAEMRVLQQRNAELRQIIIELQTKYDNLQDRVLELKHDIAAMKGKIDDNTVIASADRISENEKRERDIKISRIAAGAALCRSSYKIGPDNSTSTTFVDLSQIGGRSCFNGVYSPPH